MSASTGGTPSDLDDAILTTGNSGIEVLFVSMSGGEPSGRDGDYLEWHTYDHRVEQFRLPSIRSSMRLLTTPACLAARLVSEPPYDDVRHVMTYFFDSIDGLGPFTDLAAALGDAGRMPLLLPSVERNVFRIASRDAAPGIEIGADVLPWWPAEGVYLLVERGHLPLSGVIGVDGVGGAWSTRAAPDLLPPSLNTFSTEDPDDVHLSYIFLDRDPLDLSDEFRLQLQERWATQNVIPLLAAPFYPVNTRRDWEVRLG